MRPYLLLASLLVPLLVLSSCATMKKGTAQVARALHSVQGLWQDTGPRLPKEAPPDYRQAVLFLEEMRFAEALGGFESYLKREPTSQWTQAALLNSGRALEGLGRWTEAAERYRAVIANTDNAPRLQALALYRMSFCDEALGDDQKAVATLSDVLARKENLDKEVGEAELPARLAAAYARVGNFEKAEEFYRQSERGIAHLKSELKPQELPDWLTRTLFFMGNMSGRHVSWENFETTMRPLARAQFYLMQAAEVGDPPWSDRGAEELMGIYRDLWTAIEKAPLPEGIDPIIARREIQKKQWDRAALLFESLQELRAVVLPEDAGRSTQVKRVIAFVSDIERRINALMAERPAGEGLTEEALLRKQRPRGRVVDPSNALEMRFLKSAREANERADEESKNKSEAAQPEDPNL